MSLILTNEDIILGRTKRLERVAEAISWQSGTQANRSNQIIWRDDVYEISLGKPGKEAASDYTRCKYADGHSGNNPNDMLPLVKKSGEATKNITFAGVFRDLLIFNENTVRLGELFGALLVRSAFMADHEKDEQDNWRYRPSVEALNEIKNSIPLMYDVSTESFLHYLDALALNEDVKYDTLGYNITQGYGRINNLMTYANVVAAGIGKIDFGQVLGGFARPPSGVSALARSKAFEVFPELGTFARLVTRRAAAPSVPDQL